MADANLIKKADLARVREIDFAYSFGGSLKKLTEALGVTRMIPKQAGTVLKAYKATGTLENGNVELTIRESGEKINVAVEEIINVLKEKIK